MLFKKSESEVNKSLFADYFNELAFVLLPGVMITLCVLMNQLKLIHAQV